MIWIYVPTCICATGGRPWPGCVVHGDGGTP